MLRRRAASSLVTTLVSCAAVTVACSSAEPNDPLMVTDDPVAATAATSPPATATPAGTTSALSGTPTAMVVDPRTRTLAIAVAEPPAVLLYRLTDGDTLPEPTTVPLPAPADTLAMAGESGPLLASTSAGRAVVRVELPGGDTSSAAIRGEPVSAAQLDDSTLVAVRDRKAVAVVKGDRVFRMITGEMLSADQVVSTGSGAVVLDRLRNAVFELDLDTASVAQGLRAGKGATNAVTDRFGRVLVADTRGGALLAFSLNPLLLRQNYPVAGAPYGLAYDAKRDLLWVTLTETNEVVGYDVAGGEPTEKVRYPSVEQPNFVAVEPSSGRVIVASATGKGVQVMTG
jgi:DNA-binding beta-propeller fold protein YncE